MQPSDPTPEEKMGLVQLEWFLRFGNAPNANELIDAYAHAVYQRGVRDAREAVLDIEWAYLDGTPVRYLQRDAVIRALTPPEPTE